MASSPEARTMKHPDVREKRRAMLALPHVAPLAAYACSLRVHGKVPDFDPRDRGINAEVLFLFEKPGPMASGSGFISRDNDDPTAVATMDFMAKAGLARERTVTWNVVPWWNGTVTLQLKAILSSFVPVTAPNDDTQSAANIEYTAIVKLRLP